MKATCRRIVAVLTLSASAIASFADDDVDLQVRGNEKVDGTLRPAEERESFLVDAPRGAVVTASVKKTGTGGPVPGFQVLDGASTVVATATATPTGAKLVKFTFPASALYRLRVAGDDVLDGDYQFKVKAAPQAGWSLKVGASLGAAAETTFPFAAPAGSTVDVTLRPVPGSAFVPRIVSIDGPAAFTAPVDATGATPRSHRVQGVALGATGDYTVRIRNDGTAAGEWTIAVRVKPPRVSKTSVDIRDSALTGSFGGDDQVFGRVVGPAGGVVDPSVVGGPFAGSSVNVLPGSMSAPAVIAVQASDTFFVSDATHPAGVAISLTPSGTRFIVPVLVTVPYDPQAYDDPATEVTVYVQNAQTGALEAVQRNLLTIDTAQNTVTFPASHFSKFQPSSERDRPLKGTFVQLEVGGRALPNFGGQVVFGLSRVSALKGPRSGNSLSRTLDHRSFSFGPAGISHTPSANTLDGGTITVQSDKAVTLVSSLEGPIQFVRGRNDDLLIQPPSQSSPGASASILLRVAKGAATLSNLAGEWDAFVLDARAAHDDGGTVILATAGQTVRLTFGRDGTVKAGKSSTQVAFDGVAAGTWDVAHTAKVPPPGTLTLDKGLVTLRMDLGGSTLISSITLVPVLKGDALVGIADAVVGPDNDATTAALRLMVLVRVAKGSGPAVLTGPSLFSSFGLVPTNRDGAVQDLGFTADDLVVFHDGKGKSTMKGPRRAIGHDANGAPQATPTLVDQPGLYSVAADGTYRESAPLAFGTVAPRGGFYVATKFTGPLFAVGFGVVAPGGP